MLWIIFGTASVMALYFGVFWAAESTFGAEMDKKKHRENYKENSVFFLKTWLFSFLVMILTGLLMAAVASQNYSETSQTGDWTLLSFLDSNQFSNKDEYCPSGNNCKYSFSYQDNDGNIQTKEVDISRVAIYVNENCSPHVVEYTTYPKCKMDIFLRALLILDLNVTPWETYEVYVPKSI